MKVYEVINDRIMTMLKEGVVPWRQPWAAKSAPKSLVSKKEYRGVNVLLLGAQAYKQPYWLTMNQCNKLGGRIMKGEHHTPIVFWNVKDDPKNPGKKKFILIFYKVWNVAQCTGIDDSIPADTSDVVHEPIQECENIVKLYKDIPAIDHGGSRAFYSPHFDRIGMPVMNDFHSPEEYYSTLFHELVHSTGHKDRLDREGITNPIQFASHAYSKEELVAECGSAYLCGAAGIENRVIENQAAYIGSWLKKLQSEPKWIVEAAGKAMKAADHIRGIKANEKDEPAEEAA